MFLKLKNDLRLCNVFLTRTRKACCSACTMGWFRAPSEGRAGGGGLQTAAGGFPAPPPPRFPPPPRPPYPPWPRTPQHPSPQPRRLRRDLGLRPPSLPGPSPPACHLCSNCFQIRVGGQARECFAVCQVYKQSRASRWPQAPAWRAG